MGTLTVRLPDGQHDRFRQLARHRKISMNKLIEELSAAALAEFDAESRFRIRAASSSTAEGPRWLEKPDRAGA